MAESSSHPLWSHPCPQDSEQPELQDIRLRCQQAMREHVPHLASLVMSSLRDSEPAYRSGVVPPAELPQWIGQSIDRALDAFQMPQTEVAETLDVAQRTGTRRGRQGVPLRALLRSYHIGGRVLSSAVMQWANAEGFDTLRSAMLVSTVWDIADAHSAAAATALCAAQEKCADPHSAGYLMDALLNGDVRETTVATVARAFGLPEQGRYAVIVQQPMPGGLPASEEDLVPRFRGMRLIWRMHGESALGVVVLGAEPPTLLAGLLTGVGDYRVGISAALTGLAALGRARQQAEFAARTLRAAGLAFLEERLHAAILNATPGLARELQWQVLAPVLALETRRRELLLSTLEAWLAADGAVARVAADLYCHRNTVLNRLRRIEQLTGRSLSVPKDLVDLALALEAYRQVSHSGDVS